MKAIVLMLFAILLAIIGVLCAVLLCYGADSYFWVILIIVLNILALLIGIAAIIMAFGKVKSNSKDIDNK